MPEDKPPELTRRSCLKLLAFLGIGGYVSYRGSRCMMTKKEIDYSPAFLADDLPTIKGMILEEGKQYFSAPEITEEEKVDSLEEFVNDLFPEVQDAMHDYLGLEQKTEPSVGRSIKAIAIAIASGVPIFSALYLQSIKKSVKAKKNKRALNWLTFSAISFGMIGVINSFSSRGHYIPLLRNISATLKDDKGDVWNTTAHEYAHHLYFDYMEKPLRNPRWLREGFAYGLAWSLANNYNDLPFKQNSFRKSSLMQLVSTYNAVCEREGIEPDLPSEYDEFNPMLWGEIILDGHAMGYTFFRLRERQRGQDIYRRILLDGNFNVLKPLPPDGFADRWL